MTKYSEMLFENGFFKTFLKHGETKKSPLISPTLPTSKSENSLFQKFLKKELTGKP